MAARRVLLAMSCLGMLASSARAQDADQPGPWGVTVWGLSYHFSQAIDYDEHNWGAGLRYYFNRFVFAEGDVLRNSNRGLVLPVSVGVEVPAGHVGACKVAAVGAATLAYYQNLRTESNYFRFGPVPGVAFRCGRFQPNIVAILTPSHQIVAAIAASLTILLPPRSG